ncbi:MAG: helix-turn-helix domain-containing protein [Bacillota bacterium]|nr:helix-turn-helix domain-containing protein [Bacillota bacterium]
MTHIGAKIKKLREDMNLTLKDLAEKSGVGKSTISEIETGKATNPKTATLQKLSNVLGVTVNDLLSTEEKLDIAIESMSKIAYMAKDALDYHNNCIVKDEESLYSNDINSIVNNFKNETFSADEQNEIINYIKFVISKRK